MIKKKHVFLCLGMMCCMLLSGVSADAAASRQALQNKLGSSVHVLKAWYDDYDGDGTKELFAVTGTPDGGPNAIYFSGEKWAGAVYTEDWAAYYEHAKPVCKVSGKQKLFVMEFGAYGSGSLSKCFYVKNGRPYMVNQTMEGLSQIKGKDFAIYPSAFDWSEYEPGQFAGHTWKRYYLKWTGTAFKEYKGKYISQNKLREYENGAEILQKIKAAGYTADKIILRKNNLIQINLHQKQGTSVNYENVTLRISGGAVSVVKRGNANGNDIVSSSSYGGIYVKSIM